MIKACCDKNVGIELPNDTASYLGRIQSITDMMNHYLNFTSFGKDSLIIALY